MCAAPSIPGRLPPVPASARSAVRRPRRAGVRAAAERHGRCAPAQSVPPHRRRPLSFDESVTRLATCTRGTLCGRAGRRAGRREGRRARWGTVACCCVCLMESKQFWLNIFILRCRRHLFLSRIFGVLTVVVIDQVQRPCGDAAGACTRVPADAASVGRPSAAEDRGPSLPRPATSPLRGGHGRKRFCLLLKRRPRASSSPPDPLATVCTNGHFAVTRGWTAAVCLLAAT